MKLGFVVIYVEDVRQTMAFYQEAFGMNIRMEYEGGGSLLYGEMETEGAVLCFASYEMAEINLAGKFKKVSPDGAPVGQEIVFIEEDVAAVYERAVAAGAVSISAPSEKTWGQTVAYLRAKEGTLIEVCSPMAG